MRWVTSGIKAEDLVSSKACSRTLLRHFYQFLNKPPLVRPLKRPKETYLKIDGSYFKRWGCALAYKEGKEVIFWNFVERENYLSYYLDLSEITKLGYVIKGITSDRHPGLVWAIKTLFPPDLPHQYCLVHLQRFCQTFLTQNPQTQAGRELLELVRLLNQITSHYEANIWLRWLDRLIERYKDLIKQRTYFRDETGKKSWWYTHKNLRRVFRALNNAKNNLFFYLDYPGLAKDINGLEAEFSHLKEKTSLHRGLKRERKKNLVKWYFYFKSKEKKPSEVS